MRPGREGPDDAVHEHRPRTAARRGRRTRLDGPGARPRVHSGSAQHYLDAPLRPVLVAVADNAGDERLARAMAAYGFSDVHADWRELVAPRRHRRRQHHRPELHPPRRRGRGRRGRQAPLAGEAGRAQRRGDRRDRRRGRGAPGSRPRSASTTATRRPSSWPAGSSPRAGSAGSSRSGSPMLADYAAHPEGALTWRYQNAWAGSGVLGDLVSHGVDLGRYVVGEIDALVCDTATFITERPALSGAAFAHTARGTGALAARSRTRTTPARCSASPTAPAARSSRAGSPSASSARTASRCTATRGALAWDFRRMGELQRLPRPGRDRTPRTRPTTSPRVTASSARSSPGSGIAMSYDDLKVVEAHRLVRSIATGTPEGATDHGRAARPPGSSTPWPSPPRERRWVDTSDDRRAAERLCGSNQVRARFVQDNRAAGP